MNQRRRFLVAPGTLAAPLTFFAEPQGRVWRIAVLSNLASGAHPSLLSRIQDAARQTGKQVYAASARTPEEIESRFAAMVREHGDAVILLADVFLFQQRKQIARLAFKPSVSEETYCFRPTR